MLTSDHIYIVDASLKTHCTAPPNIPGHLITSTHDASLWLYVQAEEKGTAELINISHCMGECWAVSCARRLLCRDAEFKTDQRGPCFCLTQ